MKRIKKGCAVLLLALVLAVCGTACSADSAKEISIYELQKAMLAADEALPDMSTVNSSAEDAEALFAYLSDMDYSKVQSFFLAYSSEGLADELAVIVLKNAKDTAEAVSTLEAHKTDRINVYTNYMKDQVARAENALIFSQDRFAVLIISDAPQTVRAAFEDFVNGNSAG